MKIRIEPDELADLADLADLVSEMRKALAPKPQEPGGVKAEDIWKTDAMDAMRYAFSSSSKTSEREHSLACEMMAQAQLLDSIGTALEAPAATRIKALPDVARDVMGRLNARDELIIQIRDAAEIRPSVSDSDIPGITREIYTAKNPKEEGEK